jgi:hypothetical protein
VKAGINDFAAVDAYDPWVVMVVFAAEEVFFRRV